MLPEGRLAAAGCGGGADAAERGAAEGAGGRRVRGLRGGRRAPLAAGGLDRDDRGAAGIPRAGCGEDVAVGVRESAGGAGGAVVRAGEQRGGGAALPERGVSQERAVGEVLPGRGGGGGDGEADQRLAVSC